MNLPSKIKNKIIFLLPILYAFLFSTNWNGWIFFIGFIFSFVFVLFIKNDSSLIYSLKKIINNVGLFAITISFYIVYSQIILDYDNFLEYIKIKPQEIINFLLFLILSFFFFHLISILIIDIIKKIHVNLKKFKINN